MNLSSLKIRHYTQIKNMIFRGIIFFLALVVFAACNSNDDTSKQYLNLPVLVVDTSTAITVKDYIGTIEGKVNVEIRSQVEGALQEIYVDEGQYITEGQPLFKIDPSTYVEILNNEIATANIERSQNE